MMDVDVEEEYLLSDDPVAVTKIGAGVRWVHFIQGCAVLLPWNALITATPYFLSRVEGSPLRASFSSYLSLTFMATNFGFLAHATATSEQASPSRRVLLGSAVIATLCAFMTLSTYVHVTPGIFFAFVLVSGIIMAAAGSYLQNAVVAGASLLGPTAMQAVMAGQAAVGVVVNLTQLLSTVVTVSKGPVSPTTRAEEDKDPEAQAAFIFFGLSTVFVLCSAVSYTWLTRTPEYKALVAPLERQRKARSRQASAEEREGLVYGFLDRSSKEDRGRILQIAKTNAIFYFSVGYVFFVTLTVFPSITISILSTNPATNPFIFASVNILIFNLGDFLGRVICSWPRAQIWSSSKLFAMALLRTIFIPLFLLCNVQRSPSSTDSRPVISSDLIYMLILLAFGLTNGHVSSLIMMAAPSIEHNPRLKGKREDVDIAATLGNFITVAGMVLGSLMSFAVRSTVCQCNPFTS